LHLSTVCGRTTRNVKALISINGQGGTIRNPRLRIRLITRFDDDRSAVGIAGGSETSCCTLARVNDMSSRRRGCARVAVDDLPFLIGTAGAGPNLRDIAVSDRTPRVVQAATTSAQLNGVASGDPLLILISGVASIDLHLGSIIEVAAAQIQAFIAEDLQVKARNGP